MSICHGLGKGISVVKQRCNFTFVSLTFQHLDSIHSSSFHVHIGLWYRGTLQGKDNFRFFVSVSPREVRRVDDSKPHVDKHLNGPLVCIRGLYSDEFRNQ